MEYDENTPARLVYITQPLAKDQVQLSRSLSNVLYRYCIARPIAPESMVTRRAVKYALLLMSLIDLFCMSFHSLIHSFTHLLIHLLIHSLKTHSLDSPLRNARKKALAASTMSILSCGLLTVVFSPWLYLLPFLSPSFIGIWQPQWRDPRLGLH